MQIGQFANCLVDARNELQHKYVLELFPRDPFPLSFLKMKHVIIFQSFIENLLCLSALMFVLFCDRADVIQRKFTITKALLFKADRSSFDRLRQQVGWLNLKNVLEFGR